MGRKRKFNSILVQDSKTDNLLLISFENGKIANEGLNLDIDKGFLSDRLVNGRLPPNKILLTDVIKDGENSSFAIKACVDLILEGKSVNFWDIVENPDYVSYFLQKVKI